MFGLGGGGGDFFFGGGEYMGDVIRDITIFI